MFNTIFLGAPGSGKTTQSKLLVQKYKWTHICPGDLLRNEVKKQTPLGKKVENYMNQGILAPDNLVAAIVEEKMKKTEKDTTGFLIDGFPRTKQQATILQQLLHKTIQSQVSLIVMLNVQEEVAQQRIKSRKYTLGRPDDQKNSIITKRIQAYKQQTLPLVHYYQKQHKVIQIDAEGTIQQINEQITQVIDTHLLPN